MDYQVKRVYELAKEFGCSEKAIIKFLITLGRVGITSNGYVVESEYNLARNHFLGIPIPEKPKPAPKPQEKPKSTPSSTQITPPKQEIDAQTILNGYAVAEIEKSPIKYYKATQKVVDELLNVIQSQETAQKESIGELTRTILKLNAKYIENPHLTPEENTLLATRQEFLVRKLAFGSEEIKREMLLVKEQAEVFFKKLSEINMGYESLREMAKLEREERPSFGFLVENLVELVQSALTRLNFFTAHKKIILEIISAHSAFSEEYKSFRTSLREEMRAISRSESIEEEIFINWYDEWAKKRILIEQRLLPLFEFVLKGYLGDKIGQVVAILRQYRDKVDEFYLNERKNIYQKFVFTSGGDLQEKFEVESEINKLSNAFQRELQDIIFSTGKTEEKIFIIKWSEPIINLQIDEINEFIEEKKLKTISDEIMERFTDLRRQNFAEYLSDAKTYADAIKKRADEFNGLIFRMRKEINAAKTNTTR